MSIAYAARGGTVQSTTAATTGSVTVTASIGDTIIVAIALVGLAPTSVTDNASTPNIYTRIGAASSNTEEVVLFVSRNIAHAPTSVTATFPSSRFAIAVSTYTGVASFGRFAASAGGATSPATINGSTQDANNWVVGAFANKGTATWGASTGNLRENVAGGGTTTPGAAIVDSGNQTSASGSVTVAATESAANAWAATYIELRSSATPGTQAFDASATSITAGFNSTITKTWTHVVTGTNPLLVVCIDLQQDVVGTGTATAVTYNSVALTKAQGTTPTGSGQRAELWYLAAPPTGSHTVSVTITGATDTIAMGSMSFTGVAQTTPLDTSTSADQSGVKNPSIAITTGAANCVVVGMMSKNGVTGTPGTAPSFVNQVLNVATNDTFSMDYDLAGTAGVTTLQYANSDNGNDCMLLIASFLPASGANGSATLTGNSITSAVGTIVPKGAANVTLTGNAITSANGTVVANGGGGNVSVGLTGNSMTASVGTMVGVGNLIVLDAVASSTNEGGINSTPLTTWLHSVASGATVFVVSAALWQDVEGSGNMTVVTYGGVALTKAVAQNSSGERAEIWYLLNPSTSPGVGSHTVSVTVDGLCDEAYFQSSSWKGAAALGAVANSGIASFNGNPSLTMTTQGDNSLIIGVLARYGGDTSPPADSDAVPVSFTNLYNSHNGSNVASVDYFLSTTSAGPVTNAYNNVTGGATGAPDDWEMVMAEFKLSVAGSNSATVTGQSMTSGHGTITPTGNTGGVTFSDSFSTGTLDTSNWQVSTENPSFNDDGGVTVHAQFSAGNVDLTHGMLGLKLTCTVSGGVATYTQGEVVSTKKYGYGTYTWVAREGSTATTPNGTGFSDVAHISGQISGLFNFFDDGGPYTHADAYTEIDFEVEGQFPTHLEMTSFGNSPNVQTETEVINAGMGDGFHTYTFVWQPGQLTFFYDGVQVSVHTSNVPTAPAFIDMNFWGLNGTDFGGVAVAGTRWLWIQSFSYTNTTGDGNALITGNSLASARGTIFATSANGQAFITGNSMLSANGVLTTTADANVTPTGVSGTMSVGAFAPQGADEAASVAGNSMTASVGGVFATGTSTPASAIIVGRHMTSHSGTMTAFGTGKQDGTVHITGRGMIIRQNFI